MFPKDIIVEIAKKCDDLTAANLLLSDKRTNNSFYFSVVFNSRYPDLIKYEANTEFKIKFYLQAIKEIEKLKRDYDFRYETGDLNLQKDILETRFDSSFLMIEAISKNCLEIVKYLVEKYDIPLSVEGEYLVRASENGNLDMIKYFVEKGEKGSDIHWGYENALRWAIHRDYLEIVKYFVEKGADIHVLNDQCFNIANQNGNIKILEYLRSLP